MDFTLDEIEEYNRRTAEPQIQPQLEVQPAFSKSALSDYSPPPQPKQGWDWGRAISGYVGGLEGIQKYDESKLSKSKEAEERPRRLERHNAEMAQNSAVLDDYSGKKKERDLKMKMLSDSLDPNSDSSRSAAKEYSTLNAMRAKAMFGKNPELSAVFAQRAKDAQSMSQSQIARMEEADQKLLGEFGKMMDRDVRKEISDNNIKARTSSGHSNKSNNHNTPVKPPPVSVAKEMSMRNTALREAKRMKELLPKLRYTGVGADAVNSVLSISPNWADIRTDDEREFVSLLGKIKAKERKNIYGAALSSFDVNDSEKWLISLRNNPATLESNLGVLIKALDEQQRKDLDMYHLPPDFFDNNSANETDSKAIDFVKANPDDPRTPAIIAKLKAKGLM